MTETILTPEGAQKIEDEIAKLKDKRKHIIERIARAKDLGDLKENADYHDARDEQGFNEARIQELEALLRSGKIVEKTNINDTVQIGARVTITHNGEVITYMIVGANESSPTDNKLSMESPLVKAMLGKKKGDTFTFVAPSGEKIYTITEIH